MSASVASAEAGPKICSTSDVPLKLAPEAEANVPEVPDAANVIVPN